MPFLTSCPSCSRQLRVPDELTGRNVKCPDCGTIFPAGTTGEPAPAVPVAMADTERLQPLYPSSRDRGFDRDRARQLVMGPAVALIIVSLLHCLGNAFMIFRLNQAMANPQAWKADFEKGLNQRGPPRDQQEKEMRETAVAVAEAYVGPGGMVFHGILIFIGAIILVGAILMMRLSSRGWAMTAAIFSVIPCVSGCCVLGIPFGIWALVALSQPDVREAFAHRGDGDLPEHPSELDGV